MDAVTNALWTIDKYSSSPDTLANAEPVELSPVERGVIQLGDPENYFGGAAHWKKALKLKRSEANMLDKMNE